MKTIIYHNPRCSKSRATLQLIEEKNVAVEVVKYLETPPTKDELAAIITKLGIAPRDLIRFNESKAKELNISAKDERSDAEWIEVMVDNPVLIERPIVVKGNKATIGRPPESVLEIL